MAFDEALTAKVRAALADADVDEVRMFGGIGFLLAGNMVAAASSRGLLVRVGEDGKADAIARGARPMVMNGREMKGFVWVDGSADARTVKAWLRRARTFVATMPAKPAAKPRPSAKPKAPAQPKRAVGPRSPAKATKAKGTRR